MRCSVCGEAALERHLDVAGEMGEEGLIPTTDSFGVALADIDRCRACGHMQLSEFPDAELISGAYAEATSADYLQEEPGQRRSADELLERVEAHVAPGRLLDVGCWVGFLADQARRRGWDPVGIEPSGFAREHARRELGLEVHDGSLMDVELPPSSFDAVVMGDVIEHLEDPGAALRRTHGLLAPAGVVAMTLPDAGSRLARAMGSRWWSVIPTHLQYFTRSSVELLLARCGFTIAEIDTAPKAFSVDYYLSRLGGYSPGLARAARGMAGRAGLAERLWAPDFRDRMVVVAVRD